jgi:hypothetical protein
MAQLFETSELYSRLCVSVRKCALHDLPSFWAPVQMQMISW